MTNKQRLEKIERRAGVNQAEILIFTETDVNSGIYKGQDRATYTRAEIAELEKDPNKQIVLLTLRYEGQE